MKTMSLAVKKLRAYTKENKITIAEMAEILGCSAAHLYGINSGRRMPSIHFAYDIEKRTNGGVLMTDWMEEYE